MSNELGTEHVARYDPGGRESITTSVIVSVAAVAGVEPTALPPLQRTLDTDALNAVFGAAHGADTSLTVTFGYAGFRVTVDSDCSVRISEPTRDC